MSFIHQIFVDGIDVQFFEMKKKRKYDASIPPTINIIGGILN